MSASAFAALSGMTQADVRLAIECEMGRRNLATFVRQMWPEHHPATPLMWNWHIDCICEHLEAVYRGQIQRLIVNVPPGFSKSLLVSVYFPAWVWTHSPTWQFLCTAAANDVVLRDARRMRELCACERYSEIYCPDWKFLKSQDAKGYFQTDAGGYRISRTTGQAMTGLRGDCKIMDDPLDASHATSDKSALEEVNHWYSTVFSSRNNSPTTREILIMQRLHELDMTGYMLGKDASNWIHLNLPMEYDPKRVFVSPLSWVDPREKDGELLFPKFVDANANERIKGELGEAAYSAQYQQQPIPEQGNVFKREWFRYWLPDALPKIEAIVASCDFNRLEQPKHTRDTDYAVIQVWGIAGRDRYLLREERQKMGLAASIQAVKQLHEWYPDIYRILVEKSANGPSVIAAVASEVEGVEGVSVQGETKIQRAGAVSPVAEQGRIYIPDPEQWPWVEYWIEEVCGFPGRRRDDRVDAFTMAIIWIEKNLSGSVFSFAL